MSSTHSPEDEIDYRAIAWKLMRQCEFALTKLKADGWTGIFYTPSTGKSRHWKEDMADAMDLLPGVKVDREMMHACSLPKKQREKEIKRIKAEREAANLAGKEEPA